MCFHLGANPVEILINGVIASPGVKPHRLTPGIVFDLLPVIALRKGRQRREQQTQAQ